MASLHRSASTRSGTHHARLANACPKHGVWAHATQVLPSKYAAHIACVNLFARHNDQSGSVKCLSFTAIERHPCRLLCSYAAQQSRSKPLATAMAAGVGFHNAALEPEDREAVEGLFLAGDLPVCTTHRGARPVRVQNLLLADCPYERVVSCFRHIVQSCCCAVNSC